MALKTRQFPRYKFTESTACESKIIDSHAEQKVTALDLSPTGIAFTGSLQLKPGDVVTLEVAPFGGSPIKCSATIVRTTSMESTTLYGARFLGLPLLYQERLLKVIRAALFSDSIDQYSKSSSLKINMTEAALLKRLLWIAFMVFAISAVLKIIGVLT